MSAICKIGILTFKFNYPQLFSILDMKGEQNGNFEMDSLLHVQEKCK